MNAERFIELFGEQATRKGGALEDIGCPQCGNREVLKVRVRSHWLCFDEAGLEGCDDEVSPAMRAKCPQCDYDAPVSGFTIEGLDERLEAMATGSPIDPEVKQ